MRKTRRHCYNFCWVLSRADRMKIRYDARSGTLPPLHLGRLRWSRRNRKKKKTEEKDRCRWMVEFILWWSCDIYNRPLNRRTVGAHNACREAHKACREAHKACRETYELSVDGRRRPTTGKAHRKPAKLRVGRESSGQPEQATTALRSAQKNLLQRVEGGLAIPGTGRWKQS